MPILIDPAMPAGTLSALTQPTIAADGLKLRPWEPSDYPVVTAAYSDPAIQRWHCRSLDEEEALEWIGSWAARWQAETGAGWAVVDGAEVVGQISLRTLMHQDALAEVSYWVMPGVRGRRIAARALSALAGWSFAELGLHRLEVYHSTLNPASCRVAVLAGFAAEGTKRGEARHADGWHDMHLHARLASDR